MSDASNEYTVKGEQCPVCLTSWDWVQGQRCAGCGARRRRRGSLLRRFVTWVRQPEVIGHPDCPILHRWTIVNREHWKLMLHHFQPHADDRDVHDHPRPFITVILRGGYTDVSYHHRGGGRVPPDRDVRDPLYGWGPRWEQIEDEVTAPGVRYRAAHHIHKTRVHAGGCWTLVLMGPLEQGWGFFVNGIKMPWRTYHSRYGSAMRCTDD